MNQECRTVSNLCGRGGMDLSVGIHSYIFKAYRALPIMPHSDWSLASGPYVQNDRPCPMLILVDTKKSHPMQSRKLCNYTDENNDQIDTQRLLSEVSSVCSEQVEDDGHCGEQLPICCGIRLLIHLLPERQSRVLPLIFFSERGSLGDV